MEFVIRKLLKQILICGDCDLLQPAHYKRLNSIISRFGFVAYINSLLTILFLPPSCWWRIFGRLDCWNSINAVRFRRHSCWPHFRPFGCPGTDSNKFHIFWDTSALLIPLIWERLALLEHHPNVHHQHACEWPLRSHNHRGLCRPRNT